MTIIQQIHQEFNTAGESLLKEAQALVNEGLVKKANRLEGAGFVLSKEVLATRDMQLNAQLAGLIMDYQVRYPNNEFITKEQVLSINKKYNLICAPAKQYKGFVPDKNLKEIESFSVRKMDIKPDMIRIKKAWGHFMGRDLPFLFQFFSGPIIHRKIGMDLIPADDGRFYWGISTNQFNGAYIETWDRFSDQELSMCAPSKDFSLKGVKKFGSMFLQYTSHYVPDPVVLQPVKGGYLIVTAWGDESTDEIVVNQKMN